MLNRVERVSRWDSAVKFNRFILLMKLSKSLYGSDNMANVLVLCSGGIDSTACLSYYLLNGYSPCALWVDYGQAARVPELNAVKAVTEYFTS